MAEMSAAILKMQTLRACRPRLRLCKAEIATLQMLLQVWPETETLQILKPRHYADPVREKIKTLNEPGSQMRFVITCMGQYQGSAVFSKVLRQEPDFT